MPALQQNSLPEPSALKLTTARFQSKEPVVYPFYPAQAKKNFLCSCPEPAEALPPQKKSFEPVCLGS